MIDVGHVMPLAAPENTVEAGARFAEQAKPGTVLALVGELGAGKTHFVQGLTKALGASTVASSPTFSLVQEYKDGRAPIFHFDFYRIEDGRELLDLGWDDYLDRDGVIVVEWADRFPDLLPDGAIWLRLSHDAETGGRTLERLP